MHPYFKKANDLNLQAQGGIDTIEAAAINSIPVEMKRLFAYYLELGAKFDESDQRNVCRLFSLENPDRENRIARQKAWLTSCTDEKRWDLIQWTQEALASCEIPKEFQREVPDLSVAEIEFLAAEPEDPSEQIVI